MKHQAFNDEVKFQVGERVRVDFPEVPIDERDSTSGIIVGISTRFPTTSTHRTIGYQIWFDGSGQYIKRENMCAGGIGNNIVVSADKLTKEKLWK